MLGCSNLAETDTETAPDLSAGGSGNSVTVQMMWEWLKHHWLVVLTILKNKEVNEGLSHIFWKINMFKTTNQIRYTLPKNGCLALTK